MQMPERITFEWVSSLSDDGLLAAESRLHRAFAELEREQKALLGNAYELVRGPAELMSAWDRWSRVNNATRARGLNPQRR